MQDPPMVKYLYKIELNLVAIESSSSFDLMEKGFLMIELTVPNFLGKTTIYSILWL